MIGIRKSHSNAQKISANLVNASSINTATPKNRSKRTIRSP